MADEQRTDEIIRGEISAEREQLVGALSDLRKGIAAKRRLAGVAGTLIVAGLAAAASIKVLRRFRGG